MADCIDALIDANVITTIKSITIANGYNTACGTVERVRSNFKINGRFPFTLVIRMETDPVEEDWAVQQDELEYLVWYLDGKNDDKETANTEFSYRLRNVGADFVKALKLDPSRGGYAQNTIVKHGFGMLECDECFEPGVWISVKIHRAIDKDNPYLLA
jgi:hypothetical protein